MRSNCKDIFLGGGEEFGSIPEDIICGIFFRSLREGAEESAPAGSSARHRDTRESVYFGQVKRLSCAREV